MRSPLGIMTVGVCLALGTAGGGLAASYYVDDNSNAGDVYTPGFTGLDSNDGLTPTTPKRTLNNLISSVTLGAGDVVYIDTGTYAPATIPAAVKGVAGDPIVFQGSTNLVGGGTVFSGSGLVVVLTVNGSYLQFRDLRSSGGTYALYMNGAAFNEFTRAQFTAGTLYNTRLISSASNVFRQCVFFTPASTAFSHVSGAGNYLENCVLYSPGATVMGAAGGGVTNMVNCIIAGRYPFSASNAMPDAGSRNVIWATERLHNDFESLVDLQRNFTNWQGNVAADPLFLDAAAGDYHLLSAAGFVSNGVWVTNAAVGYSPAIDFGRRADLAYTNEPSPNGGRVNAGIYGGTAEASKSRTNPWLFAMSFNDGGTLLQTARLEWVAGNMNSGTVNLHYSTNNGSDWVSITNGVAATNESHQWTPAFSHPRVFWRVTSSTNSALAATNAKPFSIRTTTNTVFTFFVNDGSTANDVYTTDIGNDAQIGNASNAPRRSLQSIVNDYALRGGDTIYVDTGDYTTNLTISIGGFDSGSADNPVRIIGSPKGTTFNRGNTAADTLDLTGAVNLEIEHLRLLGGRYGLNGGTANIVLRNMQFISNRSGVYVTGSSHTFERCLAADNTEAAFTGAGTGGNRWLQGVLWNNPTLVQAGTNSTLSVSNSILGNGTVLFGNQAVPGDHNLVWNCPVGLEIASFTAFQNANFWTNSLYADPQFANAAGGDYHLKSLTGRYNPATGLFVTDAVHSAAIDLGNPAAPVGAESLPNGGRLNVGLYGGMAQASRSRSDAWLQVATFNDGGTLNAQAGIILRWLGGNFAPTSTVTISLSRDNGASWEALATGVQATNGFYHYLDSTPDNTSSLLARWKVTLDGASPVVSSQTPTNFTYLNGTFAFYVNDASTAGDVYCTAPGNDENIGVGPGAPMASLGALLNRYDLEPGAIIYVDTGRYFHPGTLPVLTSQDSGLPAEPVLIQGSTNRMAGGSVFGGASVLGLGVGFNQASNIVLRDIQVSNVVRGVAITNSANIRLEGIEVRRASDRAFDLQLLARNIELLNCVGHGGGIGAYLQQVTNVIIRNCVFWQNTNNAVFVGSQVGALLENSILGSTSANMALYSIAPPASGFSANYNGLHAGPDTRVGVNRSTSALADNLAAWQALSGGLDARSVPGDPRMADPDQYDYHLKTQETLGRTLPNGQFTADSVSSPLLDAGNPSSTAWTNEPGANGGRINIGRFGGTREASIAPTMPWLQAVSFADAGGVSDGPVPLNWIAGGGWSNQTAKVEVSLDGGNTWGTTVTSGVPITNGLAVWTLAGLPDTPAAAWRVVCLENTNSMAQSTNFFAIRNASLNVYVATADTNANVYCPVPGRATNWMATASAPLDSLRTVFERFDLEPGDRIWVDSGTYAQSDALVIGMKNSGTAANPVRVTGNTNAPFQGTVLARVSRTDGSAVIRILQAGGIRLEALTVSNAWNGIEVANSPSVVMEWVRVTDCLASGIGAGPNTQMDLGRALLENNLRYGLQTTGGVVRIRNSLMRNNAQANLALPSGQIEVKNSILEAVGAGRFVYYYPAMSGGGTLVSDYNNIRAWEGANVAGGTNRLADRFLIDWQISTGFANDKRSFGYAPLFANPAGYDFHLQSQYGRFDPGTGAHILTDTNTSRLIDLGDPADLFGSEPMPNGGRINVGLYGNTPEASKSSGQGALVPLTMSDGGTIRGEAKLYWAFPGIASNEIVKVQFSGNGGETWSDIDTNNIYASAGASGLAWQTTNFQSTAQGVWRVMTTNEPPIIGQTETWFALKNQPLAYYINDGSMAGDVYCEVAGSPAHTGLGPDSPLDSLARLLGRYKVEPGDTVYVDTGRYPLSEPMRFTLPGIGATNRLVIQGSTNEAAGGTVFTNSAGSTVIEFQNVQQMELRDLHLHGGARGLRLNQSSSNYFVRLRSVGAGVNAFQLEKASDQNRFIQCAALDFFRTGFTMDMSTNNYWISGVIAPVGVTTSGTAMSTGTLMDAKSGRLYVSNSVFAARGPADVIYQAGPGEVIRGDYNCYHRVYESAGLGVITDPDIPFGVNRIVLEHLGAWRDQNQSDTHSMDADPLFADLSAGDLHPRSAQGRYSPATGEWVADAETSPLIDAADPALDWTLEPGANGRRANIGVYGNTPFASQTPSNGTFVLRGLGQGGLIRGSQSLEWFARGSATNLGHMVDILVSTNSGAGWQTIGASLATTGSFAWDTAGWPSLPTFRWRVQSQSQPAWRTESERDFMVRNTNLVYYVNDGSTANDLYTTAPGAATNTGRSAASPLASLGEVLERYDLEPGDIVWVDTGVYSNAVQTAMGYADSGTAADPVQILGSTHPDGSILLDRGVWFFNVRGCRLENMRFSASIPSRDAISVDRSEDMAVQQVDVSGSWGTGIGIDLSSNVVVRNFSVAGARTNGVANSKSYNTLLEFGVLWSNALGQIQVRNAPRPPRPSGDSNTNGFVTVSNCVLGAFGQRIPVYAIQGNLQADFNNLFIGSGALAGLAILATFEKEYDSVGNWSAETGQDLHSLSHDPRFADAGAGDFHLKSSAGRYHPPTGEYVLDSALENSPLIDAGDPARACTEPAPNGGRANIGRHGNTPEASKTPTNAVLTLISFNDGGRAVGTDVPVNWLARGAATNATVSISYSADGGATWTLLTNGISASAGLWVWNSTHVAQSVQAKLKIQLEDGSGIFTQSDKLFAVRNQPFSFYINDDSTTNDVYCTVAGNNANSGLTPEAPMADFNALLAKYDLDSSVNGGDVVYIDTGVYRGVPPWRITQTDSAGDVSLPPVVFQGVPRTSTGRTILDRSFAAEGITMEYVIGVELRDLVVSNTIDKAVTIKNSLMVTAEDMTVEAGNLAFSLENGAGLRLSRCLVLDCVQAASIATPASLPVGLAAPLLEHNVFWQPSSDAIVLQGAAVVRNNIFASAPGQYVYLLNSSSNLVSDYNAFWRGSGGRICRQIQPSYISPVPLVYETVGHWAAATGQDRHSFDGNPLLADPLNRDFHLQSQAGRFLPSGGWTNDALSSPLIDAGWPQSEAWSSEPDPNGGWVNIGLYGGTLQASKSPTNAALHLVSLNGGGIASGPTLLSWKAAGATTGHTVRLEVSSDNGATWVRIAEGIRADLGEVVWNSLGLSSSPRALWRVQDEQQAGVEAVSERNFTIHNDPIYYYVNDESQEGDLYCSAPGTSGNTGLSPASPRRQVADILTDYDLEPGDVIYVDAGNYPLAEPIVIGDLDAGDISRDPARQVTIQGSTNLLGTGTLFVVPDPEKTGFLLDGTYGIRFSHLEMVGPSIGLAIQDGHYISGDWLRIRGCGNGISIQSSSNIFITHSVLDGNQNAGIRFAGGNRGESLWVDASVLWSNRYGIYLLSGNVYITNSIVGAVAPGSFGFFQQLGQPGTFQSDYNNLFVSGPNVGVSAVQSGGGSSARTSVYATVAAWTRATGMDVHSLAQDPQLADPGNGDFHLKARSGRYLPGTGWVFDSVNSPLLDSGDPLSPAWTAEPAPNGRRLNMGLYGGTAEASKSPMDGALTLISLNDGGVASGQVELQWTVGGAATNYTLCLEYSPDDGATWTNIICGWPASKGNYSWDSVPYGRSALGRWRAYCLEDESLFVTSQARFTLRNGGQIPYYVNDASTAGDVYCTAPGNDTHDGLTPATPKASLQAILDEFELEPVDVVYVDAGTYFAGAPPITITQTDSGWSNLYVTIQGSTNPAAPTMLRAPSLTTPFVMELKYAVNVRLKNLSIINAAAGLVANYTSGCELDSVRLEGNQDVGLQLQNDNEGFRLVRSILRNNNSLQGGLGAAINRSSLSIENSVFWGSPKAVFISSGNLTVTNSVMEASGPGGRIYDFASGASATAFRGDYNAYSLNNGALICEQQRPAIGSEFYGDLPAWTALTGADRHSMSQDPLFADAVRGDFHPRSTQGRFVSGIWTNDAVLSPLVDAGAPGWPADREPAPNGGIINIGAYGNTPESSMTQTNPPWLRVVSYNSGGTMAGTVLLYWLHGGMSSNAHVQLEYSTDYEISWNPIASNLPAGSREYAWDVSGLPLSIGLNWKVVLQSDTNVFDISDTPASLKTKNYDYYVNDGSTAGDVWCSSPGMPWDPWTTIGTNPAMPIDSLNSLLEHYPVGGGDRVYVDTGIYPVSSAARLILENANAGTESKPLLIFGSTNILAGGTQLIGDGGTDGLIIRNTRNIEISDMRISGSRNGLTIQNVSGIRLTGLRVFNNLTNGLEVAGGDVELRNSLVWANGNYGLVSGGQSGRAVVNCTFWGNQAGQILNSGGLRVSNSILVATNLAPVFYEAGQSGNVNGDYNLYGMVPGGTLGTNTAERISYVNLRQWQDKERDLHSLVADPLFINPAAGDFHLQSRAGYWSNGTWATAANTSWAIDAGDPAALIAGELPPHGGRINLGAFGGTAQASKSDSSVPELFPTTLRDGGVTVQGQPLFWLYRGLAATNNLRIQYSPDGGLTWVTVADGIQAGSAPFYWFSSETPTPEALWRIVLQSNTNIAGTTSTLFTFRPTPLTYYVNDASTTGDVYTSAFGAAGNKGYVSRSPLHSIRAVLDRYQLGGGDEIKVDTGSYLLTDSVFITPLNSGSTNNPAKITGSTNFAAGGSWLQPAAGFLSPAFQIHQARYIQIANFRLTGFTNGVASSGTGTRFCTLADLDIQASIGPGVALAQAQDTRLERVLIRDGLSVGLSANSSGLELLGCVVWSNRASAVSLSSTALFMTNSVLEASGSGNYCYLAYTNVTMRTDYNNLFIRNGAQIAFKDAMQYEKLPQWVRGSVQDLHSLSTDPLFSDPAAGDFHPRSRTGRYQPGTGWVSDVPEDGRPDYSPLIDMGDPRTAWSNEPASNGGLPNIGLYGNTWQASKSNTNQWLLAVTAMSGGIMSGGITLTWGYGGGIPSNALAQLQYSYDDGTANWSLIGNVPVGAREFYWQSDLVQAGIERFFSSPAGRWQIFLVEATNLVDRTDTYFGLRNNPFKYYVNDLSTANDIYAAGPGDDANMGFYPAAPKLTLGGLLADVDLEPTDQVLIDTGVYESDTNVPSVRWEASDAGAPGQPVLVRGSTHPDGSRFVFTSLDPSVRGLVEVQAPFLDVRDLQFVRQNLEFTGSGLIVSNLSLTNGSLEVRSDASRFEDIGIDRGSVSLSGMSNRLDRMRLRWGDATLIGTNAVLTRSVIYTTNQNAMALTVNAVSPVVSNCTVVSSRGTAVAKYGIGTLRLGHNILVAGGVADTNAVISWQDGGLLSDWNNLLARDSAWIGVRKDKWEKLAYWQAAEGQDANSVSFDPLFQNELQGDFHLNSMTGRWSPIFNDWDVDGVHSPLIDLGNPWIGTGDEPWPNGYRRNLGAYGGSAQASKSLTNLWLTALTQNDGGVLKGSNVVLRWAAGYASGKTVALQYFNGSAWTNIATGLSADTGTYMWDTTTVPDSFNAKWRVVAEDGSGVSDETDATFPLRNHVQQFYVNDASQEGDMYCSAPGAAAHNGLTPATPKANLQQILDQYDLEGGDTVYVDTGTYSTNANLRIIWSRSGDSSADVVIQGNTNVPLTVLDRSGATGFPAVGIDVKASQIQLNHLVVKNVDRGFLLDSNRNVTIRGGLFMDTATGVAADGAQNTQIRNTGFWRTGYGVSLNNTATSVLENLTFAQSILAGIRLNSSVLDTLRNNIFVPRTNAYAYAIGTATSLLANATLDYNLYDFSAEGSDFYAGAPFGRDLRRLQVGKVFGTPKYGGLNRDFRSAVAPASLADIDAGDFHPRSEYGRWENGGWTLDTNTSWAVDHGDPDQDAGLEPSPNGGRRNIGMYGNTVQASKGDSVDVSYDLRTLVNPNQIIKQDDPIWPMIWSAHGIPADEQVQVQFSGDGGLSWITLTNTSAHTEYYVWQALVGFQTVKGRWRVIGVNNPLVLAESPAGDDGGFDVRYRDFEILTGPLPVRGLMRFDWAGGVQGLRYRIEYSDDFGQTWHPWEEIYNGPAPMNRSNFVIPVGESALVYTFEDRTSYLRRTRWYRIWEVSE